MGATPETPEIFKTTIQPMTPPTRNPWPTATSTETPSLVLDRATLDAIQDQLAAAIRKGQARCDWRHAARAAVRSGIAAGLITRPTCRDDAQAIHGARARAFP